MTKNILLHDGQFALVDDEDFERLSQYRWRTFRGGAKAKCGTVYPQYVRRHWKSKGTQGNVLLHREILGDLCIDKIVDHRDGNPLNNQKSNLRICSQSLNLANQKVQKRPKTSVYKGVYWSSTYSVWIAHIKVNRVVRHLGRFKSEHLAAEAYNNAAQFYWGEFANLNNIAHGR